MNKKLELSDPQSCLNRSKDEEPVFVLVARDVLAPLVVSEWANRAEQVGVNAEKVQEARDLSQRMRDWQDVHGFKQPD